MALVEAEEGIGGADMAFEGELRICNGTYLLYPLMACEFICTLFWVGNPRSIVGRLMTWEENRSI